MSDRPALENVQDILPLTPMQQFTLLEIAHAPGSIAYFEQFTFLIRGPIDPAAYQRAWESVIARYPALRAQFIWQKDDRPLQIIRKHVNLPWTNLDWSTPDAPPLDDYLARDRATLFKLTRPPLMRFALARLEHNLHRVIWSFHHILIDAWSVSIILADVHATYHALTQNHAPDLPPPASFQSALAALARFPASDAERYWTALLAGLDTPTPLPASRPDHDIPGRSRQPTVIPATLPDSDYTHIRQFARENRFTLSTLMLAAWTLVLSRYTRNDDIIFGTTFSGRSLDTPDIERIVGLLMNAAPVRTQIPRNTTIADFLSSIQKQISGSTRFEQTPLSDIHRCAHFPPRTPLFNSIVVFGNYPLDDARSGRASPISIESPKSFGWTDVPLTLMVTPWKTFDIEARFDTAAVDPALVRQLLDDTLRTMRRLAVDPALSIDAIQITDDADRHRLLTLPNQSIAPNPPATIQSLFAEQARKTPSATAYRFNSSSLTFAALDRNSVAIAAHLIALGVSPNTPIAVCIEPSLQLPTALLGVLRANCCYVPLDPTYPAARLEHILRDAAPPFVLATADTAAALPPSLATVIDIATIKPSNAPLPSPDATVAYITYTSGSTGLPKGVRGTHAGAINRFRWMWNWRPFQPNETTSWQTTINFVDHVWEAFGPLLAGVPINILPHQTVKDPRALVAALRKNKISRITVVPALLEAILDTHPDLHKHLPHLRLCVSSGEALSWNRAQRFLAALPHVELINLYGSSEIAADATAHVVTSADIDAGVIPIGRPISNVKIALLDHRLHPTPPNVPGIIHVAGPCLADGYHNRPDLTAERFLQNPIPELNSSTLFNTGDLARWNNEGNLEYLGRADNQTKIRGFRVELGEVEHTISMHPAVLEAAVIARNTHTGTALHAYFVPANGSTEPTDHTPEIRRFLKGRLPDYMLPSALIPLDHLPRTPNGKLNRTALPDPTNIIIAEPITDPTTRRICEIFQSLLALPAVGPAQSFFDLGGHSLLAVKLVARIEAEFKKTIPLAALLRASTPAALRDLIEGNQSPHDTSVIAPFRTTGSRIPFFCIHGMDGNVLFLERLLPGLSPDQPLYGIMARGVHGDATPLTTIEDMADHYLDAIRTIQPQGPYILGGYSLGGAIALEIAHRLTQLDQPVERIIMIDTRVLRQAAGRSLQRTLRKRFIYQLRSGPRHFLRTLWIGPVERNAYKLCARFNLPIPRRLRPWPVRFANLSAYFKYRPRPWAGPISLLRAQHQEDEYKDLHALGWENFARGELNVHPLPCDHLNFFGPRSAGVLARELDRILTPAPTHTPASSST